MGLMMPGHFWCFDNPDQFAARQLLASFLICRQRVLAGIIPIVWWNSRWVYRIALATVILPSLARSHAAVGRHWAFPVRWTGACALGFC